MKPVDIAAAEHYRWGEKCDGWHLLQRDDVSIIQERVPPGKSEVRHHHGIARQFFFVLAGEATIEVDGNTIVLHKHEGLEIPPLATHQFRNDSSSEVVFLVVSVPKSHGDRVIVP
jgi:mannose-6-phosphate isomerase-like protein (cupin superfamily)